MYVYLHAIIVIIITYHYYSPKFIAVYDYFRTFIIYYVGRLFYSIVGFYLGENFNSSVVYSITNEGGPSFFPISMA